MSARGPVLTTAALAVVAVAAALGVVLGTTPGSGAAATPITAATDVAAPDGFTGRWSGPLRERGGPTVDLRLTVADARSATLEIPALGCTYTGTIGSPEPTGAVVTRLRTTANPQRLCTARATVRLTPLAAHSLRYELLRTCDAGGACVRKDAAALLIGP